MYIPSWRHYVLLLPKPNSMALAISTCFFVFCIIPLEAFPQQNASQLEDPTGQTRDDQRREDVKQGNDPEKPKTNIPQVGALSAQAVPDKKDKLQIYPEKQGYVSERDQRPLKGGAENIKHERVTLALILQCISAGGALIAALAAAATAFEARRSVEAAMQSAIVTKDIGEAQTRAYLECNGGKHAFGNGNLYLCATIKNYGTSPAKSINVTSYLFFQRDNTPRQPAANYGRSTPSIAPNETYDFEVDLRKGVNWYDVMSDNFASGIGDWTLRIEVSWLDVFDRRHTDVAELEINAGVSTGTLLKR